MMYSRNPRARFAPEATHRMTSQLGMGFLKSSFVVSRWPKSQLKRNQLELTVLQTHLCMLINTITPFPSFFPSFPSLVSYLVSGSLPPGLVPGD